ncbi:type VII secretion target [Nocardia bhagyanarayanae]|uniref:Excreted virulence factor EspC (Type VII ESX diderm) n=1 Tax=Nocardia bhagyanarayanae TaxID=1215925 RepID=A0A543F826_9NOCA|nr:type VII secretion target [Nocardia bhagyanarayanae]TQM29988.1 excreted virulence factor EspC (type VII ESX diderm) [Nocardia bhagyanarayanae]
MGHPFSVDPAKMRDLARHLRSHASTISVKQPIAKVSRDLARQNMQESNLAVKVEESLKALDSVIKYHVRRLNEHGDAIDTSANAYEQSDGAWANGFK